MKPNHTLKLLCAGAAFSAVLTGYGQSSPSTSATSTETPVQLSTFQVSESQDKGYRAGNSVSATRIDTAIKDLPFAINAFTQQFIQDTGANDLVDIVKYAPGVTSSGREFSAGNAVFSIRGFDQTPQRNGFVGNNYVDTVAIERVEVVKGPASVLYGQVAPGGTVNYITKRPTTQGFTKLDVTGGSYGFLRTTVDENQPVVGDRVLARFNGAWENNMHFIDPTGHASDQRWVIAPTVAVKITPTVTLISDYEWYHRRENAPQMYDMNMDIPGLSSSIDSSDLGFMPNVPYGKGWTYGSRNDWRKSDNESLNEELIVKLTDYLTLRAAYTFDRYRIAQKLTGGGSVTIAVPASYGTGRDAALAFAAAVMSDPVIGLTAPTAIINRRVRLQETFGMSNNYQSELVGKFDFSWAKIKPLLGVSYSSNRAQDRQRQISGLGTTTPGPQGALIPPFPAWDLKQPSTINYNTDFDPTTLPLTTYSQNVGTNKGAYFVLSGSFLEDHLQAVAGLRYNTARAYSNNFLNGASHIGDNSPNKTAPQVGLGYKITPDSMLYASYSEAFVVNNSALTTLNVPVGPAKPTTSKGYEVGLKTDFLQGRISSTLAVYQIENRDRIISFNIIQANSQVVITTTQGTKDRSRGIEEEVTYSPTDNWQVYFSASLDDIRVIQVPDPSLNIYLGSHPEATVKALASVWTRYNFADNLLKGYWVAGGANYTGRKAQRLQNPYLFLRPYTLLDVVVGRDWVWDRHPSSLTVSLKNIGNEYYFPANQERGLPRRLMVEYTVRF